MLAIWSLTLTLSPQHLKMIDIQTQTPVNNSHQVTHEARQATNPSNPAVLLYYLASITS